VGIPAETVTCGAGDGCSEALATSWAVIAGTPVTALGAGMYLTLTWFFVQALRKHETLQANEPWIWQTRQSLQNDRTKSCGWG